VETELYASVRIEHAQHALDGVPNSITPVSPYHPVTRS